MKRERDVDAVVDRAQPVPVELGGARIPPVDVPDGDGEAVASRRGDEPDGFVRVRERARLGRGRNVLPALDMAELGLHAGTGGARADGGDEGRVVGRRQLRSVSHHGAGAGGERGVDQLAVVDVVELDARRDARRVGDGQEGRQEQAAGRATGTTPRRDSSSTGSPRASAARTTPIAVVTS